MIVIKFRQRFLLLVSMLGRATKCIVEDDIEIDLLRCGRNGLKELVEMMTVHFFTISRIDDAALPPLVARNQHEVNPEACREQFRKFLENIWSSLPDSVTCSIYPLANDRTNFEDILYTLAVSIRNWLLYGTETRGCMYLSLESSADASPHIFQKIILVSLQTNTTTTNVHLC